ncbi:MAG TPA: hypothetical protein PKI11_11060 [Candidatus Hydrogenedentes bacterium]|nr:hypothetical protein [Candidatus Hydrogenedentota bacterium]
MQAWMSGFNAYYRIAAWSMLLVLACVIQAEELPRMPSGPDGPGRFGAYYTTLRYEEAWDASWRIGPHADVVVRFDTGSHKFVFWRGTSYIPCWVTGTGIWYTNAFVERSGKDSPNTQGCCEPMSDKQCRYSHVRIIENTDARAVIHWRYAPVDVGYNHPFTDPNTGWSDWVDEYYYLYPDAVGVRSITVHTSAPDKWMEWHEAIVLNQPGTMPEDNIELAAVSLANLKGEDQTFTWTPQGPPPFSTPPENATILKINIKAAQSPFAIIPSSPEANGLVVTPFRGHGKGSCFNFWDHWPVSTDASDGRLAESARRPSHSSLVHMAHQRDDLWNFHSKDRNRRTKIMLHGMTHLDVAALVPLAKSWENAAPLTVDSAGYNTECYDPAERAYHVTRTQNETAMPLILRLLADEGHPLLNPAFVIQNWGGHGVVLQRDGHQVERGSAFRFGHRHTQTSTDLIVWLDIESTAATTLIFRPEE